MENKTETPKPAGWNDDVIAKFLDKVRQNQFATFHQERALCNLLAQIENLYLKAINSINNTKHGLYAAFLIRSHSSHLAACNLAWACQITETFALLRLSLESAMYGVFISKDEERFRVWLNRHTSEDGRIKVRQTFPNWALLKVADELGRPDSERFRAMYEETIDRGAHPNERYLTAHMSLERKDHGIAVEIEILGNGGPKLRNLLVSTARTGICCLMLFALMFPDRFSKASIDSEIMKLRNMLWE